MSDNTMTAPPAPVTNLTPGPANRLVNWRRILLALGPVALIAGGGLYYLLSGRYVTTDDAYVKSRIITVTAAVSGQVIDVPIKDNQLVKTGDVLVRIDPEPYRLKLAAADADLARTSQEIDSLRAKVKSLQADLAQANTDLSYYQKEYARQEPLVRNGAIARSGFDKAARDVAAAQGRRASIEEQIRSSLAQLGGDLDTQTDKLPAYAAALAARDIAAYNLDRTAIRAARDGRVGSLGVRVGEYVEPGKALFPEIVTGETWIEANLRETDLTYVRDGQKAIFTVDAYPGREFHAVVQSFSPATGSELSVLPAQNATGNWVKIVQRVPLKLMPEPHPDDPPLRAGLSVNVSIDTGSYRHLPAFLRSSQAAETATP